MTLDFLPFFFFSCWSALSGFFFLWSGGLPLPLGKTTGEKTATSSGFMGFDSRTKAEDVEEEEEETEEALMGSTRKGWRKDHTLLPVRERLLLGFDGTTSGLSEKQTTVLFKEVETEVAEPSEGERL